MDWIPPRHQKKPPPKSYRKNHSKNTSEKDEKDDKLSQPELSDNWQKYEENTLPSDFDVPDASNFEDLLSAPVSVGSHFVFNSEKSWETMDDWYNRDEYFQLNLAELSQSLATIPFYERQAYSKDIFTAEEIEDMENRAKIQYHKRLAASNCDSKLNKDQKLNKDAVNSKIDTVDEFLDVIKPLHQTTHQTSVNKDSSVHKSATDSTKDSTDDIQKWLDDILVMDS